MVLAQSPTKRPTFAFTGESGYTLAFASRSAHSGSHAEIGVLPPVNTAQLCATNRIALNATFAILDSATLLYTYISRFSVNPNYQQREKIRRSCRINFIPQPFLIPLFNFAHKRPSFAFMGESAYTLGFRRKIAHKGLHAETGAFRMGRYHFRTFANLPGPGIRTAYFAAFGSWLDVLPKNVESLRDSDAHDARRCPEASRPRWAA